MIDHAIEYVRASQNPDGGFRYMLNSGGSAFARSAAGVATLQYAGIYEGEAVERGLEYIRGFAPPQEQSVGHYFYGHYYAAQAMFLAGDARWHVRVETAPRSSRPAAVAPIWPAVTLSRTR